MLTQPISLAKKSKVRKNNFAISYTKAQSLRCCHSTLPLLQHGVPEYEACCIVKNLTGFLPLV